MRMWSLRGRTVEGALRLLGLGAALVLVALAAGNSGGVGLAQAQNFEGFEAGSLGPAWQTGGDAPWFVQSTIAHRGSFAAQAGEIGDNDSSWLAISGNVPADGAISFWYRVSSESGYDFLRFFIDDQEMDEWSGETGWQQAIFPITAGPHTLRWEYTKDGSASSGSDTAWLDDISFPFAVGGPQACTITVSPGQSIQEAIDQAKEGDVICLGEGTWRENIVITKTLTLKGQGPERTIIKGKEEGAPVILIESEEEIEITIEGLKIAEAKRAADIPSWTEREDGILIAGTSKVTIRDSQICDNADDGIDMRDSSAVVITNNSISGNGSIGINVYRSTRVTISNNSISDNSALGVNLEDSSQAVISNNSIFRNHSGGINLESSSSASISRCNISENGGSGIDCLSSSWVVIDACNVSRNESEGIHLSYRAGGDISNSTISANERDGILLYFSGPVQIGGCSISGNGRGISIYGDSEAEIYVNKIIENGYGVWLCQRPCRCYYLRTAFFEGLVLGKANHISGNKEADVCPPQLEFLITIDGGCYGPKCP